MTTKVKAIHNKRDLIEAVRKVAPASVQLSPTLFHDISANLKTVSHPSLVLSYDILMIVLDCYR